MATTFEFVNAAGTILANTGSVEAYIPNSPDRRYVEAYQNGDGSAISEVNYGAVEDTATLIVTGGKSTIESAVQAYMRAFEQARESVSNPAAPVVYLHYAPDGSPGGTWRSRIISGSVVYDPTILASWQNGSARLTLTFRREFFWESTTEIGPLAIVGVSAGSNRCRVKNSPYGVNYFTIPSTEVTSGSLKSPVRLQLEYAYITAGSEPRGFYIVGNTWTRDSGAVVNGLEAELPINGGRGDATMGAGDVVDATCSGGYRRTSNTITTTWADAWGITLDSAFLQTARGGLYDIIARLPTNLTSGQWLKAQLRTGSTVLWEGPALEYDGDELQSLGTFRFPATGQLPTVTGALTLVIQARTVTGTATLFLDYVQFIPCECKMNIYLAAGQMAYTQFLYIDPYNDLTYVTNSSGQSDIGPVVDPGALFLWPGRSTQLSFLWEASEVSGFRVSPIAQYFDVRAYYRPRKASF